MIRSFMIQSCVFLILGIFIGVGAVLGLSSKTEDASRVASNLVVLQPKQIDCSDELARLRGEINELSRQAAQRVELSNHKITPEVESEGEVKEGPEGDLAIAWRVSAIEKFVTLSGEQKERLEKKFRDERSAQTLGESIQSESLDDILGSENAAAYRQGVQAAFERVENEELEKETLWVARRIGLTTAQEATLRGVFADVERSLNQEFSDAQQGVSATAQQRVARMVAENKRRVELRAEALKGVLSEQQYSDYLKTATESSAADVEVFHDAG